MPFVIAWSSSDSALTWAIGLSIQELQLTLQLSKSMPTLETLLAKSCAITALLIHHLANDTESKLRRYTQEESANLFRKAGLETRLKADGQWPFDDSLYDF